MKKKGPREEYFEGKKQERDDNDRANRQRFERRERSRSFLPDPEVLENYNYVVEGSAERIIKLIENEQQHRHNFELNQQKYVAAAQVIGVLGVVIVAYALIQSTVYLGQTGNFYLALALCVSGFAYLGGAVLINFNIARKSKERRRPYVQNQNQNQNSRDND